MSMKKGCIKCPSRMNEAPPPPPPTRSGPKCAVKCPSKSRASPLPPQYFPTTPGETPRWPQMRQSFPREVRETQFNETFLDSSRPEMQSRNLVIGTGGAMSLPRRSRPRLAVEQPIAEYPPSSIPRPYSAQGQIAPSQAPQRVQQTQPSHRIQQPWSCGIPQRIPSSLPRPYSAQRGQLASPQAPQRIQQPQTPQRIQPQRKPTATPRQAVRTPAPPQARPTGAIRKVPGAALRIPVRTPETPSIRRTPLRRQRPVTAPVPQPVARPQAPRASSQGRPPQRLDDSLEEYEMHEKQFQQEDILGVRGQSAVHPAARLDYDGDDSLEEFETLEDACKRDMLEDFRAKRVQVLRVQDASASRKMANIANAVHLNVVALDGSPPRTPKVPQGGEYPRSVRDVLNRQWSRSQDLGSPEFFSPSPPRSAPTPPRKSPSPPRKSPSPRSPVTPYHAFPPTDIMDQGFIEDETVIFPPSPGLDEGFNESMDFPSTQNMNYGFIEDETCPDLDCGFIEDENMGFPSDQDMDYGFTDDDSMDYVMRGQSMDYSPGSYPQNRQDITPIMSYESDQSSSVCDFDCFGLPNTH